MNDYERALIRYVVDGDIRNAQKQAKIILNKIATEKDRKFKEYQLKKLDNKGPELIELPYNLQKIIAAQDVTNFPDGRFLIRPEEQSVVNKLLNTRVAALRLQELGIHYTSSLLLTGAAGNRKDRTCTVYCACGRFAFCRREVFRHHQLFFGTDSNEHRKHVRLCEENALCFVH